MADPGPVEATADHWQVWDAPKLRDALVLDAAGATEQDVSDAFDALHAAYRVRSDWGYFSVVVRDRIASRIIAGRQVAAGRAVP